MASKRRLRRNACEGKVRHETMSDAIDAMKKLYASRIVHNRKINVYRCPFCDGYHVGHEPGRKVRRSEFSR